MSKVDDSLPTAWKMEKLYHWTLSDSNITKFDTTKMREGNLWKWIYLTQNKKAWQYYANLAEESKSASSIEDMVKPRKEGKVLEFSLKPWAKIKQLDYMPSKQEIDKLRLEWYDWVWYMDDAIKNTEWRWELLWVWDVKSYIMFNDDYINYWTPTQADKTTTSALWKPITSDLATEAKKYKSADEFIDKAYKNKNSPWFIETIKTRISTLKANITKDKNILLWNKKTKSWWKVVVLDENVFLERIADNESRIVNLSTKLDLMNANESQLRKIREEANRK